MSGPSATVLSIPEPLETDDDDVSWALQTAAVQWKRGAHQDAIAWLRRGADSAVDGGLWERASQLNVIATQLEKALTGSQPPEPAPPPPSAPRFPSRVPTPASSSIAPPSYRTAAPSESVPPAPLSGRSGPASSSTPARSPSHPATGYSAHSSAPSAAPTSHSRWPTGFPPSAVPTSSSGRPVAPPPPLPPAAKKPAPIPPAPPKAKPGVRAPRMTAPEIQLGGVEELDMTEAELVEFAEEEVTYRGRVDPSAYGVAERAPSSAPGSIKSLPAYELEEDPMDGTTALPAQSSYPAPYAADSMAPDSMDDLGLPAFPLEDSVPAGPPSHPPTSVSPRSNPVPQISLRSPAPPSAPSKKPPVAPSAPVPQRFSRPVSRAEGKPSTRPGPLLERPPAAGAIEREVPPSRKPSSLRALAESEPPASSRPLARVAASTTSSPPMISMEDLEGVPVGSEYEADEATTSVPPPISSAPPTVTESMFDDVAPASIPPASFPAVTSDVSSEYPPPFSASSPPSLMDAKVPSTPVPSEPPPGPGARAPSMMPSQPPARVDRETPIPSSASELKPLSLRGIVLADVRGLCDLPEESHRLLRQRARIERMGTGEDLSFFSVVLVLEGWVKLMPAIADVTCATAAAGEVVFTQGTLEDGVALRVVAGQNGTTLATWDRETFDEITQSCPWVADELRLIADSFQALAGASLGMLGERLDDALREVVTSRCSVLTLLPGEVLVQQGKTVPGMHIVGAGTVEEVDAQGSIAATITPGDFLLTPQVLAGGVSPNTVRAGSSGALILFAPRMVAHELLVSVPPLLEILAS